MRRLGNWMTLGLVAGSLYWFEADARVLLFAFLLSSAFQFCQVATYLRLARGEKRSRVGGFLLASSRPPTRQERKWAEGAGRQENTMSSFADFMMVLAGLSFFAFALTHVNQNKELDFTWSVFAGEMALALGLTLIYAVESLVVGETPMDFDEPDAMNFHFSSRRITVLAFAVLMGGAAIVYFQVSGRDVPAWIIAGPLLLFKHVFDQKALRDRPEDRRTLPV